MARLLPLLLLSCASISPPAFEPIPDATAKDSPTARPGTYQQRWLLDRSGIELVFTLMVQVELSGALEFVALDDLGGTLASGNQDEVTRAGRAITGSMTERLRRLLLAYYLPRTPEAIRFRETGDTGWHDTGRNAVWRNNNLYVAGVHARLGPNGAMELDGALQGRGRQP